MSSQNTFISSFFPILSHRCPFKERKDPELAKQPMCRSLCNVSVIIYHPSIPSHRLSFQFPLSPPHILIPFANPDKSKDHHRVSICQYLLVSISYLILLALICPSSSSQVHPPQVGIIRPRLAPDLDTHLTRISRFMACIRTILVKPPEKDPEGLLKASQGQCGSFEWLWGFCDGF